MFDPNFKRLMYLRYADDFVILIIGSINEAKYIKQLVADILKSKCGLELNEEKTKISATKEGFKFLGANCVRIDTTKAGLFKNKQGNPAKNRMRMRMELPTMDIIRKLINNKFAKNNKFGMPIPTARKDLVNFSH